MTATCQVIPVQDQCSESRNTDFTITKRRVYRIPRFATLADADLIRGKMLPDDATAEIVSASIEPSKKPTDNMQFVRVTAITFQTEA